MTIASRHVTVTTTVVRLDESSHGDYNPGTSFLLRNRGTVSVFAGGANVSVANGFEVQSGETLAFDLHGGDQVFGLTAAGSSLCAIIQASL